MIIFDKEFKICNNQIQILKKQGLNIQEDEYTSNILGWENYSSIIDGYKSLFIVGKNKDGEDVYRKGSNFDVIVALYNFDISLKDLCLRKILYIERHLKSIIAYEFTEKYGINHRTYLIKENFEKIPLKYPESEWNPPEWVTEKEWKGSERGEEATEVKTYADKMIENISEIIIKDLCKDYPIIKNYTDDNKSISLGVLVNIFTLGNIISFYHCMHKDQRDRIAKRFNTNLEETAFLRMLYGLGIFRNCCAHGTRFYDFMLPDNSIIPGTSWDQILEKTGRNEKNIDCNYVSMFSLLILFRTLLSFESFCELGEEVKICFEKLSAKIYTIKIEDVKRKMFFPNDWEKMLFKTKK